MSQPTNDEVRRQLGPTGKDEHCSHDFVKIGYKQYQCQHCRLVKLIQASPQGLQ
jgi:hypothetical protein